LSGLRQHKRSRPAAINASTVFAITLAMVAGLIFAYVFKKVLLDRKPEPKPTEPPKVELTVAATNILETTEVVASQLKTKRVSQEEYNKYQSEGASSGGLLTFGGALGRVTKPGQTIRADQPMYENQFEPLQYPIPVENLLAPGKRAALIEVPARNAMLRVGSHVDVLCTMANDTPAFGAAGATASAVIAKDVPIVARFNTTRKGALPPPGPNRSYTLEVAPWQYAVIELTKSLGATFSLALTATPQSTGDNAVAAAVPVSTPTREESVYKEVEKRFNESNRITAADVALLFGIGPPTPEFVHRVERLYGLQQAPPLEFRYQPPEQPSERPTTTTPAANPITPAAGTPGGKVSQGGIPPGYRPVSGTTVASADPSFGFRAVGSGDVGCPSCAAAKRKR
jgi:Flp pilus assembly protein CpaB